MSETPAEAAPLLAVNDVSYRYGSFNALSHVTLEAEPGQLIAMVGRNGAGKSTLLRCIAAGIRPPQNFGERRFRQYFPEEQWETLASGPSMLHGVPMTTQNELEQIPAFFALVRPRGASSARA